MKHHHVLLSLAFSSFLILGGTAYAGEDDLDQYFSEDEIAAALGDRAAELTAEGALTPQENEAEANDDDADVTDAVSAKDFVRLARGDQGAPVWGPFIAGFRQCAPGCVPTNYNVYRRGRHTCHAQGRAIDVGAIICDGQTYPAIRGGRFAELVACMQNHMVVLYREHRGRGPTRDHYDHGHFSIGCVL